MHGLNMFINMIQASLARSPL